MRLCFLLSILLLCSWAASPRAWAKEVLEVDTGFWNGFRIVRENNGKGEVVFWTRETTWDGPQTVYRTIPLSDVKTIFLSDRFSKMDRPLPGIQIRKLTQMSDKAIIATQREALLVMAGAGTPGLRAQTIAADLTQAESIQFNFGVTLPVWDVTSPELKWKQVHPGITGFAPDVPFDHRDYGAFTFTTGTPETGQTWVFQKSDGRAIKVSDTPTTGKYALPHTNPDHPQDSIMATYLTRDGKITNPKWDHSVDVADFNHIADVRIDPAIEELNGKIREQNAKVQAILSRDGNLNPGEAAARKVEFDRETAHLDELWAQHPNAKRAALQRELEGLLKSPLPPSDSEGLTRQKAKYESLLAELKALNEKYPHADAIDPFRLVVDPRVPHVADAAHPAIQPPRIATPEEIARWTARINRAAARLNQVYPNHPISVALMIENDLFGNLDTKKLWGLKEALGNWHRREINPRIKPEQWRIFEAEVPAGLKLRAVLAQSRDAKDITVAKDLITGYLASPASSSTELLSLSRDLKQAGAIPPELKDALYQGLSRRYEAGSVIGFSSDWNREMESTLCQMAGGSGKAGAKIFVHRLRTLLETDKRR